MRTNLLLLSLMGIMLLLTTTCKTKQKSTTWQPPNDQYAFVEYYQVKEGKAIEGVAPPGMRIDGPSYSFSPETGEVFSYLGHTFKTDSLVVLLGRSIVLRGTQGGGMHSRLIPFAELPQSEERLTIENINSDEIIASFDDERIRLKEGESWENVTTSHDTLFYMDSKVIVKNIFTQTIVFHGYLQKKDITFQ